MSWLALAQHFSEWNVSEYPIRYALSGAGYTRRVALAKPPLSQQNKDRRLQWAKDHVNWERWRWERNFGVMRPGLQGAGTGESG